MKRDFDAVVKFTTHGSASAIPPMSALKALNRELGGNIVWLPTPVEVDHDSPGDAVHSTVTIFIAGIVFGGLVKPFVEGALKEAGKDFWGWLKPLICRTREEQVKSTYRVEGDVEVVFELNDQHVIVRFPMPFVTSVDPVASKQIEAAVDKRLKQLSASWESLQKDSQHFAVGKTDGIGTSESGFHVIEEDSNGKLVITAADLPARKYQNKFSG